MIKTWTLAWRKRRANRFERATNWAGTWHQARELCGAFADAHPELEVWYVPSRAAEDTGYSTGEDVGNILVDTGRRVPVCDTGRLEADILRRVPDAAAAKARFDVKAQ